MARFMLDTDDPSRRINENKYKRKSLYIITADTLGADTLRAETRLMKNYN